MSVWLVYGVYVVLALVYLVARDHARYRGRIARDNQAFMTIANQWRSEGLWVRIDQQRPTGFGPWRIVRVTAHTEKEGGRIVYYFVGPPKGEQ